MTAFTLAANAIFADTNMACDVVYLAGGRAPLQTVRGILSAPDDTFQYQDATLSSDTTILSVRVSEIAEPRPGDRFRIAGVEYVADGEPRRDPLRLIWRIALVDEARE